jgi:hypothetical protein
VAAVTLRGHVCHVIRGFAGGTVVPRLALQNLPFNWPITGLMVRSPRKPLEQSPLRFEKLLHTREQLLNLEGLSHAWSG